MAKAKKTKKKPAAKKKVAVKKKPAVKLANQPAVKKKSARAERLKSFLRGIAANRTLKQVREAAAELCLAQVKCTGCAKSTPVMDLVQLCDGQFVGVYCPVCAKQDKHNKTKGRKSVPVGETGNQRIARIDREIKARREDNERMVKDTAVLFRHSPGAHNRLVFELARYPDGTEFVPIKDLVLSPIALAFPRDASALLAIAEQFEEGGRINQPLVGYRVARGEARRYGSTGFLNLPESFSIAGSYRAAPPILYTEGEPYRPFDSSSTFTAERVIVVDGVHRYLSAVEFDGGYDGELVLPVLVCREADAIAQAITANIARRQLRPAQLAAVADDLYKRGVYDSLGRAAKALAVSLPTLKRHRAISGSASEDRQEAARAGLQNRKSSPPLAPVQSSPSAAAAGSSPVLSPTPGQNADGSPMTSAPASAPAAGSDSPPPVKPRGSVPVGMRTSDADLYRAMYSYNVAESDAQRKEMAEELETIVVRWRDTQVARLLDAAAAFGDVRKSLDLFRSGGKAGILLAQVEKEQGEHSVLSGMVNDDRELFFKVLRQAMTKTRESYQRLTRAVPAGDECWGAGITAGGGRRGRGGGFLGDRSWWRWLAFSPFGFTRGSFNR